MIDIRIGIPASGGRLVRGARDMRVPLLVSANAMRRRNRKDAQLFVGWREQFPDLEGADVALDSGGFVAWAHYGRFLWTVEQYMDLVERFPWAWYAQMDACVEPEIAKTREQVEHRMRETIRLWEECAAAADRRGLPRPVPVIQGWHPFDYAWSIRELRKRAAFDGVEIAGVGSVCRRPLYGETGLLSVVDEIAYEFRDMPNPPKLHLFGVKGRSMPHLDPEKIASIDSMAWDVDARRQKQKGRAPYNVNTRLDAMRRWYDRQTL